MGLGNCFHAIDSNRMAVTENRDGFNPVFSLAALTILSPFGFHVYVRIVSIVVQKAIGILVVALLTLLALSVRTSFQNTALRFILRKLTLL